MSNSTALFEAFANRNRTQQFRCRGYQQPVFGTVYPRSSLRWHGVPLGGLGTGFLCWDTDGRNSQCTLFNQLPNISALPVLGTIPFSLDVDGRTFALAVRGDDGSGDLTDLRYFGHFPLLDLSMQIEAPIRIEIRAYGPFIPGDAVTSNTPAIVYQVTLTNLDTHPHRCTLRYDAPEPPKAVTDTQTLELAEGWQGSSQRHIWAQANPRMGAQALEHELALAARHGSVSSCGAQLQSELSIELAADEASEETIILVWYQPSLRDSWNRAERLRYADRFVDAKTVLTAAIAGHTSWLERIIAWQSAIYARDELSPELREALVNSFYATCKNSHWITRSRPDDWFGDDGLFLLNESYTTCPLSETLPCHYLGSLPTLFFFPELERTTLEAYRHYQLASGEIPFSLDRGFGARAPNYQTQHTNGINEYIELVYRYYLRTGDEEFLREFYPSVLAAGRYVEFLDNNGDGMVEEHPHALPGEFWPANVPWDLWPQHGTSVYTGLKSLSAAAALAAMAERQGNAHNAEHWRARLARGQARAQELWNGRWFNLQLDADGISDSTCLSAQLTGEWAAALYGLERLLPPEQAASALQAVAELCSGKSPYGLVLAVTADGAPVYSNQGIVCDFARDVWPMVNFIYAATCQFLGAAKAEGLAAVQDVLGTLFHQANAMPWGWPCNINAHDGWIGHGHDYNDPQAIWSLPLAIAGLTLAEAEQPGSLVEGILSAARAKA
ncbi:MAG: hypothetical protein GXY52_03345 [Chloroflexi bacterium]|nr:hypothetical protein [Chloroflexota bacterium]